MCSGGDIKEIGRRTSKVVAINAASLWGVCITETLSCCPPITKSVYVLFKNSDKAFGSLLA